MKISIVGNANSIFDKKNGEIIDSGDMVIRFNGGVIVNPESQGNKTTILAYSKYKKNIKDFGKVEHWHLSGSNRFDKERIKLEKILGAKPSNGIIVLEKLKNEYKNDTVQLFGFDWKQTHSWYRPIPTTQEHHNYDKEREYCLEMIDQLGWELY